MNDLEFRACFVSDIHLGTADCRIDYLLDFLRHVHCDTLYLVGDVVDLLAMRHRVCWPAGHAELISLLFELASGGTRVVYIPGNHDAAFRRFAGQTLNGIEILLETVHITQGGQRMLVRHGDECDAAVPCAPVVKAVGDVFYQCLLFLNRQVARFLGRIGRPYWSLSVWIKKHLAGARAYVHRFSLAAATQAARHDFDGYICGHIHAAAIQEINGVLYCNTGDWVEHCSALVENHEGQLQLLHWADHKRIERELTGSGVVEAGRTLSIPDIETHLIRQASS